MAYSKIDERLIRLIIDAHQAFESYEASAKRVANFKGSMNWKTIKGKDYLYRRFNDQKDAFIGPRNEETENIQKKYKEDSEKAKERKNSALENVKLHANFIKGAKLNRFPFAAAKIIRALTKKGIDHKIIGTNALFAYETVTGVLFESKQIATEDIDILLDARQGMKIIANMDGESLLSLIQRTDKTFQPVTDSKYEFAATNSKDYRVDFITQGEGPMKKNSFEELLADDALKPIQIDSLKWVLSAPQFESVVYDTKGMPLRINAIDPRAFVLHKWYVSQQPDRNPLKISRDKSQARTVASMLANELPHLPHSKAISRIFPAIVKESATQEIGEFDL